MGYGDQYPMVRDWVHSHPMGHTEKGETMRGLTIIYTDLALESLCGDLEWEVLKLVRGAGDIRGEIPRPFGDRSCSRAIGGEVLVLECRELGGPDCLEVTARLVGETDPRYHGMRVEWGLLRAKLAVGSGDPLGLLWEYGSRHGHRPMAPSPQILGSTSAVAA